MGFLTGLFTATIKTALTPIAVVKDAINVVTGDEVDATSNLLGSAAENVAESFEDLGDGELL
jgi:hypothetical protein